MSWNFCTKLAAKLRRHGYAKKAAARLAGFCCLMMAAACGLLGIFFVPDEELFEPISGTGRKPAGTRTGTFLPAVFAIRR